MRTADTLAGLHASMERHRKVTLQDWKALPESELEHRPSARRWSAADCLEHIGRANDMYLGHMESAVTRAEQRGIGGERLGDADVESAPPVACRKAPDFRFQKKE